MTEHKCFVFTFADVEVREREFCIVKAGELLPVEPKAFRVLLFLLRSPHRLIAKDELLDAVWNDCAVSDNSLTRSIALLRRLLGDDTREPRYIATVPTVGYRFLCDVKVAEDGVIGLVAADNSLPAVEAGVTSETGKHGDQSSVPNAASAEPTRPPAKPAAPYAPFPGQDPTFSIGDPPSDLKTPRSRQSLWLPTLRAVIPALLIAAIGVGALAWRNRFLDRAAQPQIRSLAVLPLENLSGDPAQEYFADGMTDELTTMLAKNSSLLITSRTSVMQYKAARPPLPEIARALKVDAILEGTVSRTGDQVHMTLQLIRADTDTHLWAESYDCNPDEVAALPGEAARNIATRLHRTIVSSGSAHSVSPEAHDAYLRGRYFLQKREADKSAAYFQRAISMDPSWSEAYAGLAAALTSEGALGILRPEDAMTQGEAAARRAIELDPQDGEAFSALGFIQSVFEWKWKDAERNLKRGIALSPGSAQAEQYYSIYLLAVNRPEEAVAHARRALDLDPLSFWTNRHLGSALYFARHYDEALSHLEQALEMEPGNVGNVAGWLSSIYEMKGMRDKAVESDASFVQSRAPEVNIESMRALYKRDGWKAYWDARMKVMLAHENNLCAPYEIGLNYIRSGKPDLSFSRLNAAIDQKCWAVCTIMVDPLLDGIRSDERYNDLLKRMSLPY
jgi:TolB-like protein/DNA-binding winged helix-turn-helix (wHTH) protein/Flp pilus assembly protein TadD